MLLSQVLPYSVCKSGNKIVIEQNAQTISIVLNELKEKGFLHCNEGE